MGKALQNFRNHARTSHMHHSSTAMAAYLRFNFEKKAQPIHLHLSSIAREQISRNREKQKPIVHAIILCGRQNIALKGYLDDVKNYNDQCNTGDLQELLKFLGRCGKNTLFEEHVQNAPKHATYRSKTTQNELIEICGNLIRREICDEIKQAQYFSILADEACDVSNVEQMPIILRFVDSEASIREEFLGFSECSEGMTGKAIACAILRFVEDIGLNMEFCMGQRYDGTANMAGKCFGAAAFITSKFPKIPYVHYDSHLLNLCIASACNIQLVRNMMAHVRIVSDFFNNSPKRFQLLQKKICEIPSARYSRLIDVCRTRWLAHIDGLDVFAEVFVAIVRSLEIIKLNCDRSWNSELWIISWYSKLSVYYGPYCCSRSLEETRPLTKQLQAVSFDVFAMHKKISLLKSPLSNLRAGLGKSHRQWFDEAKSLAENVGVLPSLPRTTQRQQHRANPPADSVCEYYERVVTLPFHDHIIEQVNMRFSEGHFVSLDGFYAIPAKVVTCVDWKGKVKNFLNLHINDLPEPRCVETELNIWEVYCHQCEESPSTLSDLLHKFDKLTFPNLFTALKILATTPVTTCTCE